jgi:hypothetical protein
MQGCDMIAYVNDARALPTEGMELQLRHQNVALTLLLLSPKVQLSVVNSAFRFPVEVACEIFSCEPSSGGSLADKTRQDLLDW